MDNSPDITGKNRSRKGQFKPGMTGNPKGRPKGSFSITQAIKTKLQEVYSGADPKQRKTYLDKVIETIFDNAIVKKDSRTLNQIWAYIDGHPKASLNLDVDKTNLEELTVFFRKMGGVKS